MTAVKEIIRNLSFFIRQAMESAMTDVVVFVFKKGFLPVVILTYKAISVLGLDYQFEVGPDIHDTFCYFWSCQILGNFTQLNLIARLSANKRAMVRQTNPVFK